MWEATPPDERELVADPAKGSRHNRGCAVDLTLYDLKTAQPVAMPSGYDEMSPRAFADYAGATAEEKEHRAILREAMESEGFSPLPNEWWHYDYKDCDRYRILNLSFPPPSSPAEDETAVTIPPRVVYRVEPELPPGFHANNRVVLSMTVDVDGKPHQVRVERAPLLDPYWKVVDAVSQWRFEPAKRNGKPLASKTEVVVELP